MQAGRARALHSFYGGEDDTGKSRNAGGQRAWRLAPPYGHTAAMSVLHEWAMGRRGETARSCVLPKALRHARETAPSGVLPDPQAQPDGREEHIAGGRCRRVRLRPEGIREAGPNLRWGIACRIRLIDEVVCGPQAIGTGGPGREEAMERLSRAVKLRDTEAEDAAFVDCMRAEVRKWWQDFPERGLLAALYERAARRSKGRGSTDSRRRPSHREGLRVARAMLANITDAARFDVEWESETVSIVLADQWASRDGKRRPAELRVYIDYAGASRAYFDALQCIEKKFSSRGKSIPRPLARWQAKVASGLRLPPNRKPIPPYCPVRPAHLVRDVDIQFTLEVLRWVGIRPNGTYVSGCRIVSEALKQVAGPGRNGVPYSEATVAGIWKERAGKRRFEPELQKQMKAIADRTGPFHPH